MAFICSIYIYTPVACFGGICFPLNRAKRFVISNCLHCGRSPFNDKEWKITIDENLYRRFSGHSAMTNRFWHFCIVGNLIHFSWKMVLCFDLFAHHFNILIKIIDCIIRTWFTAKFPSSQLVAQYYCRRMHHIKTEY